MKVTEEEKNNTGTMMGSHIGRVSSYQESSLVPLIGSKLVKTSQRPQGGRRSWVNHSSRRGQGRRSPLHSIILNGCLPQPRNKSTLWKRQLWRQSKRDSRPLGKGKITMCGRMLWPGELQGNSKRRWKEPRGLVKRKESLFPENSSIH